MNHKYQHTDNGTQPTRPHPSEKRSHSEDSETDLGNYWDKWILDPNAGNRGGKEEDEKKFKSLNENSDKTLWERKLQIKIVRKNVPQKEKT